MLEITPDHERERIGGNRIIACGILGVVMAALVLAAVVVWSWDLYLVGEALCK